MGRDSKVRKRGLQELAEVLGDAYIREVDLSSWASLKLTLVVDPHHYREALHRRRVPLVDVDFLGVRSLFISFPDTPALPDTAWPVHGFDSEHLAPGATRISLVSSTQLPRMTVVFADVKIRERPSEPA